MRHICDSPKKLWSLIRRGQEYLQPFLNVYEAIRSEFCGGLWPGGSGRRPVNLIYEFGTVVESYCSVPQIRASVAPKTPEVRQYAELVRVALDHTFHETRMAETLEDVAAECMMAPIAVVDVGRHEGSKQVELDGEIQNLMEPYVRLVRLADLSIDPDATSWSHKRHIGTRITVLKDRIRNSRPFGMDVPPAPASGLVDSIGADIPAEPQPVEHPTGLPVMTRDEATAFLLGLDDRETADTPTRAAKDRMQERDQAGVREQVEGDTHEIDLWRVAIYDGTKVWIAYAPDQEAQPAKFLHIEEWTEVKNRPDGNGGELQLGGGSPQGPFRAAVFQPVPGTLLGLPGLSVIWDLHDASKKLSTKLVNQLMALKNLLLHSRSAADDAMRVARAEDQQCIAVQDAKSFATVEIGGTRGELETGIDRLGTWFGNTAGGPRQVGGTEQSASTATAASYLQNGANMRLMRFRTRLWRLGSEIAEELAFLTLFADPWATKELEYQLAPGLMLPVTFNRAEIAADAIDFMYELEAFPVPLFDANARAQAKLMFLDFVLKAMPLIQVGGMNARALGRIGRVDFGVEDVDELFPFNEIAGQAEKAIMMQNAMHLMPSQAQAGMQMAGRMPGPASPNQLTGQVQAQAAMRGGGAPGRAAPSPQQRPAGPAKTKPQGVS